VSRNVKIAVGIAASIVVLLGLAVLAYWRLGQEPAPVARDTVAVVKPAAVDSEDVDAAMQLLRDVVLAEDRFLADSTRYTDDIRMLTIAHGDTAVVFTNPKGFSAPTIEAGGEGWTAVVSSAHHKCGVVVGQIPNPVQPTAPERDPVCVGK
jgi:hypothetical protein